MQKLVLSTVILQLIPTRGTPTAVKKHDYLTHYRVKDRRGKKHMQCDCLVLVIAKKAKERAKAELLELELEGGFLVNLFGLDSSQSQRSDDSPSPPRQCRRRCLEERGEARDG